MKYLIGFGLVFLFLVAVVTLPLHADDAPWGRDENGASWPAPVDPLDWCYTLCTTNTGLCPPMTFCVSTDPDGNGCNQECVGVTDEDFGKKRVQKKYDKCHAKCLADCANGCQTSTIAIRNGDCYFQCVMLDDNEAGKDPSQWPTDAECRQACLFGSVCAPPMICTNSEADGAGGCDNVCNL